MEVDFIDLAFTVKEALWLQKFSCAFPKLTDILRIVVGVDNLGCIVIPENKILSARTKHIVIKSQFIKESIRKKLFNLKHVPTSDMVADIFTKALPKSKFKRFVEGLGMTI